MNKFWSRIFLFAVAFLLLLFFSNDFGIVNIQKTAIVVAVGLDVSESDAEKVDFTAQIAMPASSSSGGGAEASSNVSIQGADTVGEAIAELNRKTGWYPTLVHCRLVVLGEGTDSEDVFRFSDYFLRSEFVEDSCLMAMCEGRAEELLRAKSSVGDMTSAAIAKVLSTESQKTGTVCVINLRDFAKGYYSVSGSGYLPVLAAKAEAESGNSGSAGGAQGAFADGSEDAQNAGNSLAGGTRSAGGNFSASPALPVQGSESSSGGAGGSGGGKSGGQAKSDVFDATTTALFYKGKRTALLDADETLAYNLAASPTDFAYGDVTVAEDGKDVTYNLKMKIGKRSQSIEVRGGVPVFTFHIRANAQVADANKSETIEEVAKTTIVPAHVLRAAEEKFKNKLAGALGKASGSGCDLFGMKVKLYRFAHPYYDALKDTILQDVKVVYDIKFDTLK